MGPMLIYYLRNALGSVLRTDFAGDGEAVVLVMCSKGCTNLFMGLGNHFSRTLSQG